MTKREVDNYMKKKIIMHVGFGYVMGFLTGLGAVFFIIKDL